MGEDMLTIGMVVGLDYRDAELSVHDLLQELKTHPKIRRLLEGGERVGWGAKTIPSGGFHSLPSALHAPGLLLCGDGAGIVNIPRLKGVHYAIESGRLAAEAAFAALRRGGDRLRRLARLLRRRRPRELHLERPARRCGTCGQRFARGFWLGGALASAMTVSKGRVELGKVPAEPDAERRCSRAGRASSYPAPDGQLAFDKLSSVFASGNKTRDDQPNHIRIETRVPREVAELWVRMCPAQVYEVGPEGGAAPSTCRWRPRTASSAARSPRRAGG